MIDAYQYITSKALDGYKFMAGANMIYHGLNYEEISLTPHKKSKQIIYGETYGDDSFEEG